MPIVPITTASICTSWYCNCHLMWSHLYIHVVTHQSLPVLVSWYNNSVNMYSCDHYWFVGTCRYRSQLSVGILVVLLMSMACVSHLYMNNQQTTSPCYAMYYIPPCTIILLYSAIHCSFLVNKPHLSYHCTMEINGSQWIVLPTSKEDVSLWMLSGYTQLVSHIVCIR